MATVRNAPIAFRFDPEMKQALALIAEREGRSKANMMEWLIRKHCEREGLGWPLAELAAPKDAAATKTTSAKPKAARAVRKTKQA